MGVGGVRRIEVTERENPAFGGTEFGAVGPYERLHGTVFGELDPTHRLNAGIVNLQFQSRPDANFINRRGQARTLPLGETGRSPGKHIFGEFERSLIRERTQASQSLGPPAAQAAVHRNSPTTTSRPVRAKRGSKSRRPRGGSRRRRSCLRRPLYHRWGKNICQRIVLANERLCAGEERRVFSVS